MDNSMESSGVTGRKWRDMTGRERFTFVGKLIVALCTFGFVYPNVMSD